MSNWTKVATATRPNTVVRGEPRRWADRLQRIAHARGFEVVVEPARDGAHTVLVLRREVTPELHFEHRHSLRSVDHHGPDSLDPEIVVAEALERFDRVRARCYSP